MNLGQLNLESCISWCRAMEKQIVKSCTFTLSGPSGVGIGNSWGGGYFTIRYLVQLILWMLQLYYERTLILTIALLILLVHLQVNKNLHIYYAASSQCVEKGKQKILHLKVSVPRVNIRVYDLETVKWSCSYKSWKNRKTSHSSPGHHEFG